MGLRRVGSDRPPIFETAIEAAFSQGLRGGGSRCVRQPACSQYPRDCHARRTGRPAALEGVSINEAAMAEHFAVALHAVAHAGSLIDKRVLVTGCGPIGALAIVAARAHGAGAISTLSHCQACLPNRAFVFPKNLPSLATTTPPPRSCPWSTLQVSINQVRS